METCMGVNNYRDLDNILVKIVLPLILYCAIYSSEFETAMNGTKHTADASIRFLGHPQIKSCFLSTARVG